MPHCTRGLCCRVAVGGRDRSAIDPGRYSAGADAAPRARSGDDRAGVPGGASAGQAADSIEQARRASESCASEDCASEDGARAGCAGVYGAGHASGDFAGEIVGRG